MLAKQIMPKRIINITPYHLGSLEAFTDVFDVVAKVTKTSEKHDIKMAFFSTMLQSGIDGFRFYGDRIDRLTNSIFIQKRTALENYQTLIAINHQIEYLLKKSVKNKYDEKIKDHLSRLQFFLSELYLSIQTNRPLVTTLSIPKMVDLEPYLKKDLIVPLNNFFNCVQTINIESPMPVFSLKKRDYKILEEILSSDLFDDYVLIQKELENKQSKLNDVISFIKDRSINLVKKFKQNLYLKDSMVKIVQISDQFVDLFGNKATQIISENVFTEFEKILNSNQRIVIYNFNQMFTEMFVRELNNIKIYPPTSE